MCPGGEMVDSTELRSVAKSVRVRLPPGVLNKFIIKRIINIKEE